MKISEIYSAKRLKVKLNYEDSTADFRKGVLIRIEPSNERQIFLVSQYGDGHTNDKVILCKASPNTADYLLDLFEGEHENVYRCMFLLDGVENKSIEVQTYTFRSVTEYKTPINIMVSDELLASTTVERLKQDFVWDQLGIPALFCLNYKNKKKQNANIRFIGGKKFIIAQNTARGIFAENIAYLKDRYDVPVDVFIAPEINFEPFSDTNIINEKFSMDLEQISNPASYFARWNAYDELSKKMLDVESKEFGEISYTAYSHKAEVNGVNYEFSVDQELSADFLGKELFASDKSSEEEKRTQEEKRTHVNVGKIKKILGKQITTFLDGVDTIVSVPEKGVLTLNLIGNRSIIARRLAARKRMLEHKSPIKSIVALIESGASRTELINSWGRHKAVTEEFKRNFKRAKELNAEQEAALDVAINTPNIALIQGPPGTGKTTVIKAIAERFREIFEADQKQMQKINPEYIIRSPKILISSFQNEAVDNAISEPLPGDLPAYRKTAMNIKSSSRDQYQKALETWYSGLKESLTAMIEDKTAVEYLENKRLLDDEFLSYKNSGEQIDRAAKLINRYLDYVEIPYPKNVVVVAKKIIAKMVASSDVDDEDPIIKKIEALRIEPEAFEDDGQRNARRLAAHIRINDELEIDNEIKAAIEAVCEDGYSSEDFGNYLSAVKKLKKRFCQERIVVDLNDKNKINECILMLANTFSKHYLNTLSSMESKKSLIVSNFLDRLEQEYESVVKEYTMTTAATCQTSLDIRTGIDQTYDLVIIDEAARANPLDLFIPMSMGRKIVLVGDHKQLPHMLEPDVLKLLVEDPNFKDIPEIEKSLFERLFGMFSKGPQPKAILLNKQFRMHPEICDFVSEAFYDGVLQTAKCVTAELRASSPEINNGRALTFVNIPISRGAETYGASKSRLVEVEVIGKDVRHILNVDSSASIGVITFYSAQAQLIHQHLDSLLNDQEKDNVEVGTVDAFQGKEFDYVLLSCVRSNIQKDGKPPVVGFLEKPNRLCVAFSRSIRQLAVYGDAETLIQIPCFAKLYDICAVEGGGCYREY